MMMANFTMLSFATIYLFGLSVIRGVLFLMLIGILVWANTVAVLLESGQVNQGYISFLVLMTSLYWNLETFKNIAHCTVCAVAAGWYFAPGNPSNIKAALKRACFYSLGSMALGSFTVSIIQASRAIVRHVARYKNSNQCLACAVDMLLTVLDRWIEFFNKYAFAHVAIYGESFIQSAKQTWSLMESRGIDAWINDDLVGFAIICGSVVGGVACVIAGSMMVTSNEGVLVTDPQRAAAFAFMAFFIGFYLCWTVLSTVTSCVVALFVCYAEDPNAMEVNHQSHYLRLLAARSGVTDVMSIDAYDDEKAGDQEMQLPHKSTPQGNAINTPQ